MEIVTEAEPVTAVVARDERMRLRAVEVAWQLLLEHPQWRGELGLSPERVPWAEFAGATLQLFDEIARQVEFEAARKSEAVGLLACECFEAVCIAAFLHLTGQRPVEPLPTGVANTWFALARYWTQVVQQRARTASNDAERPHRPPARAFATRSPRTVH